MNGKQWVGIVWLLLAALAGTGSTVGSEAAPPVRVVLFYLSTCSECIDLRRKFVPEMHW